MRRKGEKRPRPYSKKAVAIGRRIKALRTKLGFSSITLSKAVRLSLTQLSRLENGHRGFRSKTLQRFAEVLGVPADYFCVEGEEDILMPRKPIKPMKPDSPQSLAIGRKIKALRAKQGFTTITLARAVRLSQAQVSRLENGLQGFRSWTLIRFAKVLGVPPSYFYTEGEEVSTAKVAEELEKAGLTPSKTLGGAMKDKGFLRFIERSAKAMKKHKKNLVKMDKAVTKAMR